MNGPTDLALLPQHQQPVTSFMGDHRLAPGSIPRVRRPCLRWLTACVIAAMLVVRVLTSSLTASAVDQSGTQQHDPGHVNVLRTASATPSPASSAVAYVLWQSDGGPTATLTMPDGVGIDPQGNVWVTDGVNGRFVIFSPEGIVLETWGRHGSGEGEFD